MIRSTIDSYALSKSRFGLPFLLAMAGIAFLCLFFALLSISGNFILIALGASMIVGPILLLMPEITVWAVLVVGLLFGILSASPKLGKIGWGVSVLSIMLMGPSLINTLWSKRERLPGFLVIGWLFMVFAVFCTVVQWWSIGEFVAGYKRYFQAFGLMMALATITFSAPAFGRWRKFMVFVALMQFPAALFELVVLVPMRHSASSDATDVIAGTFGANLEGGSPNSVMVIFIFIAIAFFVARWRAGLMKSKPFYMLAFMTALPLVMGETKVAVFMVPVVGAVLLREDFMKAPLRYLPAVITTVFLTAALCYVYVVFIIHSNFSDVFKATYAYNLGKQGYSNGMLLNRSSVIAFWLQKQSWSDPLGFLIGNGLGSSYTGFGPMAVSGHLGTKYFAYGINLTAASTLLWDTGIIGLIMFCSIFVAAWFAAVNLRKRTRDPMVKADALAIQVAIALFGMFILYSDSMVNLLSIELIYASVLGYLGYLMKQEGMLSRPLPVHDMPKPNRAAALHLAPDSRA
ncbi:MAG TPA: hypothetical protein VF798_00750 [Burkholderiaceae bacterium]